MDVSVLQQYLQNFIENQAADGRIIVAFSGGLDSTVLLHALSYSCADIQSRLIAVHVNHQLQTAADDWQKHCRQLADSLPVAFICEEVKVSSSGNLEASAREARYQVLCKHSQSSDQILTAHHQNDQAETLLLNLLRGSGVEGLAAMSAVSTVQGRKLLRPLLNISRQELEKYAEFYDLNWIEDPSNNDDRFSRNFLRNQILPQLQTRWPEAVSCITRSASNCREISDFTEKHLNELLIHCQGSHRNILQIVELRQLRVAERQLLIRHWLKQLQADMPDRQKLNLLATDFLQMAEDSQPQLAWSGQQVRRFGGRLFYLPMIAKASDIVVKQNWLDDLSCSFELGSPAGQLQIKFAGPVRKQLERRLQVRFREDGEKIRLQGRQGSRKLKKLLQEWQVPVWLRDHVPLLYVDDDCLAIADFARCEITEKEMTIASVQWQLSPMMEWRDG